MIARSVESLRNELVNHLGENRNLDGLTMLVNTVDSFSNQFFDLAKLVRFCFSMVTLHIDVESLN